MCFLVLSRSKLTIQDAEKFLRPLFEDAIRQQTFLALAIVMKCSWEKKANWKNKILSALRAEYSD